MGLKKKNPLPADDERLRVYCALEAALDRIEKRWSVIDYVREEVSRQGHDVTTLDGIERVGWMLNAWSYALVLSAQAPPDVRDAVKLARLIEPVKNKPGFREVNVMTRTSTGIKNFADRDRVPELTSLLFEQRAQLSAIEFYKQFENVHPFRDGNGRTGKILLNWLSGTLLKPFFPPADLFGEPIRNP